MIPRSLIFGNPERTSARISPDGARLSWIAPRNGVLNVWVAPRDSIDEARVVTNDTVRGIRFYAWAHTNTHILYLQDSGGDENWRLRCVDLSSDEDRDLTPYEGVQAQLSGLSRHEPGTILVSINDRVPQYHDVYRVDLATGNRELVLQNDRFADILVDTHLTIREGYTMTGDGGIDVYRPDGSDWKKVDAIPNEDTLTTGSVGYTDDGSTLYLNDSRGRNTAALFAVDDATGARKLVAENSRADVGDVIRHPLTGLIQAVSFTYERREWTVLDASVGAHLAALREAARGDVEVTSRSLDDRYWVVVYEIDDAPATFALYDTQTKTTRRLFTTRPALEGQPLVRMRSATIKSRDGLDMVVYYSLPKGADSNGDGIPDSPLPFVLQPHGGPWYRDTWGYNPTHQWLANRGYAVMDINFRSSTGFGKAFANAGDHEWGGKVIEDQLDAVSWAIDRGIADRSRVAVMGGSFGGYSTLAGLTMHPEVFACGVDIVGPSNLITLLSSIPEYWKPMLEMFAARVGDPRTEEGRALLTRHSPITYIDRISKPLLIGQGANDPRVKQAESDQIVAAMRGKSIPVTYVLYPDEGHGFARPENRLSFYAVAEAFLARHLGGNAEPVGDDFSNSSITIPVGANEVPGVTSPKS